MAIPGNVGNYNPSAKRGAFARSPSAAKRGVFAQSPSAAKKGIFAFSPGGGQSSASSRTSFAPSPRQAEDQSMKLLQQRRDQTRKDFFDNRQDISDDRLDRMQIQSDLYNLFKQTQMKPVKGASNLYQSVVPGGPTLKDESIRLANMYGPTFKEIGSDIGYGINKFAQALIEKGTPMMNLAKGLATGIGNLFMPNQVPVTTAQIPQAPGSIPDSRERSMSGLSPLQLQVYNALIQIPGKTHSEALAAAQRQNFANGGIATL